MPRDAETLKIEGWARDGDRVDPERTDPPIDRSEGWTREYSQPHGPLVERRIVNQVLLEITASLEDIHRAGSPLPWNAGQDYEHFAFVRHDTYIWRTNASSGPSFGGAVEPGTDRAYWRVY